MKKRIIGAVEPLAKVISTCGMGQTGIQTQESNSKMCACNHCATLKAPPLHLPDLVGEVNKSIFVRKLSAKSDVV